MNEFIVNLILAVLLLRLFLKKAPKWVNVLLWGIVAVRLVFPWTIESPVSLIPAFIGTGEWVSEWMHDSINDMDIGYFNSIPYDAEIDTTSNAGQPLISDEDYFYYPVTKHDQLVKPTTIGNTVLPVLSILLLTGIVTMLLYATISYLRLCRKINTAVLYKDNIYESEYVSSPFVLGIIKAKIYIPFHIEEQNLTHVIAHEQAHIARKDHWWKPLGFLLLTIYWFNPLMWLAYILLCHDIELACDEKVIKALENEQRADYTQALVACSVNHHHIAVCPLAFGEVGVKDRVKSVMNYKKPTTWIITLAILSCIVLTVCFLTNPISKNTLVMGANYTIEKSLYTTLTSSESSTEPPLQYCVTADYHLYYQQNESEDWIYVGVLTPYPLTKEELHNYLLKKNLSDELRKQVNIRPITDAYILKIENDNFYLVFQTKNGNTYLAYGWEDVSERGQVGSDNTEIYQLYELQSSFHSGYVNVNFFQRSLVHTIGKQVYSFSHFESDKIRGYHIVGFKAGNSTNHSEMTDLGFAVFQTTGEGYRLIDCHVYKNAALVENGIYLCEHPAVADINGETRNNTTFDVVFLLNEEVDKVERVYRAEGKKDWVQADTYINAPAMSLWSWAKSEGYTTVSQYFYDKDGKQISVTSEIPLHSASSENLADNQNKLSLNDVISLSEKGDALTWSDFEQYDFIETGSGLYIRVYEINEQFELWIGGLEPDSDPMYIYLTLADNIDIKADIRKVDITEFISTHTSKATTYYAPTLLEEIDVKYEDEELAEINIYEDEEFVLSKWHYKTADDVWGCDGYTYKYRLEISGKLPNSSKSTTYIVLSNTTDITFKQTWMASGFSSNMADYFDPAVAVIVGQKIFS